MLIMSGGFSRSHKNRNRRIKQLAVLVLLPIILIFGWVGWLQLSGNIHAIELGQAYRSAQLNGSALKDTLTEYNIKSVLNLRGEHVGTQWYDNEVAITKEAGVAHADLSLSANRQLTDEQVTKLLELLKTLPKPILIHCKSGSDRTGIAAALYEYTMAGKPAGIADDQLSFRYGHFPWLGSRTIAMENTFNSFVDKEPR